jgi:hypothetical protein
MSDATESFDSLWNHCTANGRLVVMPTQWSLLYLTREGSPPDPEKIKIRWV